MGTRKYNTRDIATRRKKYIIKVPWVLELFQDTSLTGEGGVGMRIYYLLSVFT